MQIHIAVEQRDLEEISKFLKSEGIHKPNRKINYEVVPSRHKMFLSSMTVLVSFEEWQLLCDYEDENSRYDG